jgi:hypothetical protein
MNTVSYFRPAAILSFILIGSLCATAAPPQAKRKIITHVRFVRIELPGKNKILSLAEVQVTRGGRNIAPNGIASQSGDDGERSRVERSTTTRPATSTKAR